MGQPLVDRYRDDVRMWLDRFGRHRPTRTRVRHAIAEIALAQGYRVDIGRVVADAFGDRHDLRVTADRCQIPGDIGPNGEPVVGPAARGEDAGAAGKADEVE